MECRSAIRLYSLGSSASATLAQTTSVIAMTTATSPAAAAMFTCTIHYYTVQSNYTAPLVFPTNAGGLWYYKGRLLKLQTKGKMTVKSVIEISMSEQIDFCTRIWQKKTFEETI